MEKRVGNLEVEMVRVQERMNELESKAVYVKLLLENEIRNSIMIVAEAHLNLDRKLNEAVRSSEMNEMIAIRVSVLESQMKELNTAWAV